MNNISIKNFSDTSWAAEHARFKTDASYAREKVIRGLSGLVSRVIGDKWKPYFIFELRPVSGSDGRDAYEISGENGRIRISGPNGVSLASGFNFYLKNYAFVNYNPVFGGNERMPEKLPAVNAKIVKKTPYDIRYALNFCTYGYTMAFWTWKEYESLIDWFAMNGINLMLDIVGQEEVHRRFLAEYGYTDEEIRNYIPGPAYLPWFFMQNMTSFGGPLPEEWFKDRVELARRMHDRMLMYGITPVLAGYSGMVPEDFTAKHPDADVIPQGKWCGFSRPYMLKTYGAAGKDYFDEAADIFYEKQREVFGDITDYYAVDPFHEGGVMAEMDPASVYHVIQKKMLENDPRAIWLLMQWQGQLTPEKLSRFADPGKVLVLDLQADRDSYSDVMEEQKIPWIWCMIHDFGGRMGVDGDLPVLAEKIPEKFRNSHYMKGIGTAPESFSNAPVMYDLLFDMAWTDHPVDFGKYVENYVRSRYGNPTGNRAEHILNAWNILLKTALGEKKFYAQGAPESVINARPTEHFKAASAWGHSTPEYSETEFEQILPEMITAYDTYKDCEAFIYDMVDVTKQVLANSAKHAYKYMMNAYDHKNVQEFEKYSQVFLKIINLTADVLCCSPYFSAEKWIQQARNVLPQADKRTQDLFEFNARTLITVWGGSTGSSAGLLDYSNRQWTEIIREYALPRWKKFILQHRKALQSGKEPEPVDYREIEWVWANEKSSTENGQKHRTDNTPDAAIHTGSPSRTLKALALEICEKYSIHALQ